MGGYACGLHGGVCAREVREENVRCAVSAAPLPGYFPDVLRCAAGWPLRTPFRTTSVIHPRILFISRVSRGYGSRKDRNAGSSLSNIPEKIAIPRPANLLMSSSISFISTEVRRLAAMMSNWPSAVCSPPSLTKIPFSISLRARFFLASRQAVLSISTAVI